MCHLLLLRWQHPMRILIVGFLTMMAGYSSAQAQDVETWRCTAPYGDAVRKSLPAPGSVHGVDGRITFNTADLGPEWSSVAKIGFHNSTVDAGDCHCNGLSVEASATTNVIVFNMVVDGRATPISARYMKIPISFSISIGADNVMTVKIGKQSVDIKAVPLADSSHDSLIMSCSGADVSFLNINAK